MASVALGRFDCWDQVAVRADQNGNVEPLIPRSLCQCDRQGDINAFLLVTAKVPVAVRAIKYSRPAVWTTGRFPFSDALKQTEPRTGLVTEHLVEPLALLPAGCSVRVVRREDVGVVVSQRDEIQLCCCLLDQPGGKAGPIQFSRSPLRSRSFTDREIDVPIVDENVGDPVRLACNPPTWVIGHVRFAPIREEGPPERPLLDPDGPWLSTCGAFVNIPPPRLAVQTGE